METLQGDERLSIKLGLIISTVASSLSFREYLRIKFIEDCQMTLGVKPQRSSLEEWHPYPLVFPLEILCISDI